jgi:hypothetical protein
MDSPGSVVFFRDFLHLPEGAFRQHDRPDEQSELDPGRLVGPIQILEGDQGLIGVGGDWQWGLPGPGIALGGGMRLEARYEESPQRDSEQVTRQDLS